jgi:hypothetical protein
LWGASTVLAREREKEGERVRRDYGEGRRRRQCGKRKNESREGKVTNDVERIEEKARRRNWVKVTGEGRMKRIEGKMNPRIGREGDRE